MIIEKNMNVKIKVDAEIISAYLNDIDNHSDELAELADKMSDETLSYLTTYYLAKLYQSDKDMYNKYMNTVKQSVEPPKNSENYPELNVGDTISITSNIYAFAWGPIELLYKVIVKKDDGYIIQAVEASTVVKFLSMGDFHKKYKSGILKIISK
jgi:hypothetical protein